MKILVLSDSHSAMQFMQTCIESIQPDAVIHLGDYVRDGEMLTYEYPEIPIYQVAGNCDRYRVDSDFPETRTEVFEGVRIFFTHGHLHGVKMYTEKLIADAKRCGADIVLYGHTHCAECRRTEDGMWIVNPGSAGNYGGTAAMITITDRGHFQCQIIHSRDLEE